MGDAIDIFNILVEYSGVILAANISILFLAVLLPIKLTQIRHPRYRSRYIILIFLILLVLNAILNGLLGFGNGWLLSIVLSLVVFYALFSYHAVKKPVGYSRIKLEQLKKLLQDGYSWNQEELFDKKPSYFIDFIENYEFTMLHADHLRELGKIKQALELLNQIDEKMLFLSEKNIFQRKKAFLLYELGDLNQAMYLLDNLEETNEPNYQMLKGMILESQMELDKAANHFQRALNMIDGKNEILKAMIYNNYGRIRCIEGNYTDGLYYYRLSCEIAKQQNSKTLIHVSYQNLIRLCITQTSELESEKRLDEYSELMDSNVLKDLQEFYNFQIEVARQNSNKVNLAKVVKFGEIEISRKLTLKQQLIFDINNLRLRFNNGLDWRKALKRIHKNLNKYYSLEMPERYYCMKEIHTVLWEIRRNPGLDHYESMWNLVLNYMSNEALKDLEHYLQTLKKYEINERCHFEKEKIGVLKEFHKPYQFNLIYKLMCDIKDIYKKNGLLINMAMLDLDIADECFALNNMSGSKIKAVPLEAMKKHVQLAEDNIAKLNLYPIVAEIYIRLSMYYFKMGNMKKSKKHFIAFKSARVSIHHFAYWVQEDYHFLNSKLKSKGTQGHS